MVRCGFNDMYWLMESGKFEGAKIIKDEEELLINIQMSLARQPGGQVGCRIRDKAGGRETDRIIISYDRFTNKHVPSPAQLAS